MSGIDGILDIEELVLKIAGIHGLQLEECLLHNLLHSRVQKELGVDGSATRYLHVILVCKSWRQAFCLAVAQLRWDRISRSPECHAFMSVTYIPRGCQTPRRNTQGDLVR